MRRLAFTLLVLCGNAQAHSLDELIQAAYLNLGLESLELELVMTPGQEVAPKLLTLIDQNQDGQLAPLEMQAYAEQILNDVNLRVDNVARNLVLRSVTTPQTADFLAGTGIFEIVADASLPERSGRHVLEFRNVYRPVQSTYLVNGFLQSERLHINRSIRSPDQREYRLEYGLKANHNVWFYLGLSGALLVLAIGTGLGWRLLMRSGLVPAFNLRPEANEG